LASAFFAVTFRGAAFLAAVFFAAVLREGAFFAGTFLAAAFFAVAFLGAAFLAAVFLPAVFLAAVFFGAAFFAGFFLAAVFFVVAMLPPGLAAAAAFMAGVPRPAYRPGERGSAERRAEQPGQEVLPQPGFHHQREQHSVPGTPQVRAVVHVVGPLAVHPDRVADVEHRVQDRRHREEEHEDQLPRRQQDVGEQHRRYRPGRAQAAIPRIVPVAQVG